MGYGRNFRCTWQAVIIPWVLKSLFSSPCNLQTNSHDAPSTSQSSSSPYFALRTDMEMKNPWRWQGQQRRMTQGSCLYCGTPGHFHQYLSWVEYAQNSLSQPTTGLNHRYQASMFPWSGEPSEVPAVNHWFQKSERVYDVAHHHLERAIRACNITSFNYFRYCSIIILLPQFIWLMQLL